MENQEGQRSINEERSKKPIKPVPKDRGERPIGKPPKPTPPPPKTK